MVTMIMTTMAVMVMRTCVVLADERWSLRGGVLYLDLAAFIITLNAFMVVLVEVRPDACCLCCWRQSLRPMAE